MKTMSERLMKCPRCGGRAALAAYDLGRMERFGMMRTGKAGVWYKAECTAGCGMAGEEYRTNKRQAAEDWNARCRKRERVREALRR